MLLFRVLGSWVRGLYLMGFGAFWVAISYSLSRYSGSGANPTMIGMGLIGSLTFASGVFIVLRGVTMSGQSSPVAKASAGWRDDGKPIESDTGFDPEAALSRYLENRPHAEAEPAAPPAPPPPAPEPLPSAPPRPTFGRKQV
jgi:hypothetical protein